MSPHLWLDAILFVVMLFLLVMVYRASTHPLRLRAVAGAEPERPPPSNWVGRLRRRHRLMVRQAGLDPDDMRLPLWIMRLLLAALLASLGVWLWGPVGAVLMGVVGLVLPDLWILGARRARRRRIRSALSFFLDLVVSLLYAGLSPERAFVRAGRDGFRDPHPLADEIMLMGHELEMGKERGTAFFHLAERTGVTELRAVAAAVQMGLRSGMSIVDTFKAQADLLRVKLGEEALRRINTSTVVAMVPVFLCGVPVYIVVVYFPAFLKILDMLRLLSFR
jgi:tight adherence protein C